MHYFAQQVCITQNFKTRKSILVSLTKNPANMKTVGCELLLEQLMIMMYYSFFGRYAH